MTLNDILIKQFPQQLICLCSYWLKFVKKGRSQTLNETTDKKRK